MRLCALCALAFLSACQPQPTISAEHPSRAALTAVALPLHDDTPATIEQIDLLLAYGTDYAAALGGDAAAQQKLLRWVDDANAIYSNSGVGIDFQVVHMMPVVPVGDTFDELDLVMAGDPPYDAVHAARDAYLADIAVVVLADISCCGSGISHLLSVATRANAEGSFAIIDGRAAPLILAHELGHALGAAHNPANAATHGPYPYGYGFNNDLWRTVMAVLSSGRQVPLFSSPKSVFGGLTLGGREANNVQVLNNDAPILARVRGTPEDTSLPSASISAPATNATVAGTVTLTIAASDPQGVARVEFTLDADAIPFWTQRHSPYSASLDTTLLPDGPAVIHARAFDTSGNHNTGDLSWSLTIANGGPGPAARDTTPPTVAITSPATHATIQGTVAFIATASDDESVAEVSFFDAHNGDALGSAMTQPFVVDIDTTQLRCRYASVYAVAYDTAVPPNEGLAAPVNFTLTNETVLPVAHARGPASADVGEVVTLDGGTSQSLCDSGLTYSWSQVLGPPVTLANATTANPWFVVPTLGEYRFQLVVRDSIDVTFLSTPALVTVVVGDTGTEGGSHDADGGPDTDGGPDADGGPTESDGGPPGDEEEPPADIEPHETDSGPETTEPRRTRGQHVSAHCGAAVGGELLWLLPMALLGRRSRSRG